MDWQLALIVLIVVAALVFLAAYAIRRWRRQNACRDCPLNPSNRPQSLDDRRRV